MQRAKIGPLPPAGGFAGAHRAVANKGADTRPSTRSGRSAAMSVAAPAAMEVPTMTAGLIRPGIRGGSIRPSVNQCDLGLLEVTRPSCHCDEPRSSS